MIQLTKRFVVALSFPGERREFVAIVANRLASEFGQERVLYDKFHTAEFARPNLATYLQNLYHDESELVVVFLCADYERKEWPGLESRAILDLIKKKRDASIMLVRFDETDISGYFSTDGYVDAAYCEPQEVATLIIDRLQKNSILPAPIVDLRSIRPFSGQVERRALFQPFKDFARCRDIVFALGGVGSGLTTFLDQFSRFLEENHEQQFSSADFDPEVYHKIYEARTKKREATQHLPYIRNNDYSQFDLKCLLATLAYMTYCSLRQRFAQGIDQEVPDICAEDQVQFAEYYFNKSGAMFKGALGPIVEHFLSTVQRLAEATLTDRVIVFMPWSKLAACFACQSDNVQKKLATDLWDALGEFAANPGSITGNTPDNSGTAPFDKYDKVCLIIAGSEVPYGHSVFRKALVAKSLWPIPPLDQSEIGELLGMISDELNDPALANTLLEWSGGSPWYVRLILSCTQYLSEADTDAGRTPLRGQVLIEAACSTATKILVDGPTAVIGPLKDFFRHIDRVREALGDGQATDVIIEEAWAGPQRKRERGLQTACPRVEAFVASGLTWLEGDPWNPGSSHYVFRRYPTLFLRRAGRLPLVVYRSVTGHSLELAEY